MQDSQLDINKHQDDSKDKTEIHGNMQQPNRDGGEHTEPDMEES